MISSLPRSLFARILTVLPLGVVFTASSFAASFYVAPTGNDLNDGSLAAPFATVMRGQTAASAGDTVFIRGGTYSTFTIAFTDSNYNYVHRLSKSGVTYQAYANETPVFDFSSVPTNLRVCGFHVTGSSLVVKGIQVTGVQVGAQKQSECFRIDGSAAYVDFFDCVAHDNAANGFYFTNRSRGSCTRCDSYNNIGTNGDAIGNTDGFGAHGMGVVFNYCRSWHNSDDGYDCISSAGANTFNHCWAYNMTAGGDSNGFKVGGWGTDPTVVLPNPVPAHTVMYCLSANNNAHGFYANHQPAQAATWTHNTSYNNAAGDFDMLERTSDMTADIAGFREVLHQNLGYVGTIIKDDNNPPDAVTDNSWTRPGVAVVATDFQSVDPSLMIQPRSAGNNQPFITFMHLTAGSDLVGLGCFDPAPAGPTGVQASWATSSQINVSWNAVAGATTYYVKRATVSGGPYTTIAARLTAPGFTDNTVSGGATYYYRVSAMDDVSFDEGVSAEVAAIIPPVAITGITADSGRSSSDGITSDTTLALAGTAAANSTLVVTRVGVGPIGNATASVGGAWSFDYTGTVLSDGPVAFQVTATNPADGTSFTADAFNVVVDTLPPAAPVITTVANIAGTVHVSGTAEPFSQVAVTQDGTLALGTTITPASGNWDLATSSSSSGSHSFTAVATDLAGNVGPGSAAFVVDTSIVPPVIAAAQTDFGNLASGGFTRDATLSLVGTATAGQTVTVAQTGIGEIGTALVDPSGNWILDHTGTTLPDGSYSFTATASNGIASSAASNVFALTVDTVAPAVVSIARQSPATATITSATASVVFRVTFSENVSGLDPGDFALTATGSAAGTVASISGSGAVFDVTVNSLAGTGTLRLDLNAAGTGIADAAGNPAAGFTGGDSFTRVLSIAGSGTWIQPASGGLWSDPANWQGAVIPDGSTHGANFNTLDLTANNTVHLDTARVANSLTFGDTNTATAASWLVDDNGGLPTNVLTLAGTVPTVTVNTLGTSALATISARVAGTGGLTKAGAGTLALSGTNTISGAMIASAGTLRLDTGTTFNASTIVANAAGAVIRVNGGTLNASGTATITGATGTSLIVDAGAATIPTVTFTNASGGLFRVNGGNVNVSTITIPRSSDAAVSFTVGVVITGGTSTLGTINLGTSNSNGAMSVEGGNTTVTGILTVGNQITAGRGGALRVIGGTFNSTNTASGIVLARTNGATAVNVSLANFTGGVSTVEKLTVGADNTLNGGSATVTVDGGTLYLGSGGIVKNGIAGFTAAVNLTSGILGAKADWSVLAPVVVPAVPAVPVTLSTGGTITVKAADAADVAHQITFGVPVNGSGALTKTGAGALVLAATNTFTGAVAVNAGTLAVTGSVASGGTFTIGSTGTLAGTGTVTRAVTLNSGGFIAPAGTGTTGTLTATSVTWNGGGKLLADLDTVASSDKLVLTGALTKGSAGTYEVTVTPLAGLVSGNVYTLATFASTTFTATDFTATGLPAGFGASFTVSGTSLQLTVLGPPSITTPPVALSVSAGSPANFTVVAIGTAPLSYQWYKNNVLLPAETSPTLSIASAQPANAGSYKVTVTNAYGTVASTPVTLTVTQSYAAWATANGLPVGQDGPSNDFDADGISNLLEYFLGTNPIVGDPAGLPSGQIESGLFVFRFTHSKSAIGVSYVVQVSSDLVNWSTSPVAPVLESETSTVETLVVKLPPTSDRQFARLSVSAP